MPATVLTTALEDQDEPPMAVAVSSALGRALEHLPRKRCVTWASVAYAPEPARCIAPWTQEGAETALQERSWSASRCFLHPVGPHDPLVLQRYERAGIRLPPGELVRLRTREGRIARVPRPIVGSNLVVTAPFVADSDCGPVVRAIAALAEDLGLLGAAAKRQADERTLASIADVFATITVVIDATWVSAGAEPVPRSCRKLVTAFNTRSPIDLCAVDRELLARIGLRAQAGRTAASPRCVGDTGRWPRIEARRGSGQRLDAIWASPKRLPSPTRDALRQRWKRDARALAPPSGC